MAEDDEIARLRQMESGAQESMGWDVAGQVEVSQNSSELVKEEPSDDHVLRASHSAPLDTRQFSLDAQQSAIPPKVASSFTSSANSTPNSVKRPRIIGGFMVDSDSEDEQESKPTVATLHPPPAHSASKSPMHLSATPDQLDGSNDLRQGATDSAPSASNTLRQSPTVVRRGSTDAQQATQPKARLPHDKIGILEDRIAEDPRGDIEAWMELIYEHESRNKLDEARAIYERFFTVFPTAADVWVQYAELELANDNFFGAEQIFGKSLLTVPHVGLWNVYLNYIRRRNDLTNDFSGSARATISQSYDFVLANVGMDRDSGRIWSDYIQFIKSGPGQVGGNDWRDQQKMDQLRKAYQRAICVPMANVNQLWKEYDQFEMGLNKITGRKFLQEKSPSYMTARSANQYLENITRGLDRTNIPKLPPAPEFDGADEYLKQVDIWNKWIAWEKEDPLVLKDEDSKLFKDRILYAYKQALMALRFWPEMWVDAAEWAFSNGLEKEGSDFLTQGIDANPESCLLAFKQADRLEITLPIEEGEAGIASRGNAVRAPYIRCVDALYDLTTKLKNRETAEIQKITEDPEVAASETSSVDNDDDEDSNGEKKPKKNGKELKIEAVKAVYLTQDNLLKKTMTHVWIALMRAMRRIQGKGKAGTAIGGSRGVFQDARQKGRITSDLYIASAQIEHIVYKDPAGSKIFERGAKLFPEDEVFILEYLKHLLSVGDLTNARATFETAVNRLAQKPENVHKAKPLYVYFHKYESDYGELSQIARLEKRMAELFPEDPKLLRFACRYTFEGFDPAAVRPIVSPQAQMRPVNRVRPSIEQVPVDQYNQQSPHMAQRAREISARPTYAHEVMQQQRETSARPVYGMGGGPMMPPHLNPTISPKRGYDDASDSDRPRKLARGESPLKGAAGRRLDQQRRVHGNPAYLERAPGVATIPRDITFLLSIMPSAELYKAKGFNPERMVDLIGRTRIPEWDEWERDHKPRIQMMQRRPY